MIGAYIFFSILALALGYGIYCAIMVAILFKKDEYGNPYRRTCKRCGQMQIMYSSNIEGDDSRWWEEVYPMGNNPKCKCKHFASYHQ